jgi:hypothetical protein
MGISILLYIINLDQGNTLYLFSRKSRSSTRLVLARVAGPPIPSGTQATFLGKSYFAGLRMTFRQKFFLHVWFRNKLGVGLG